MLSHSQTPFLASPFPWTVFFFVPLCVLSVWILLWWWLSGNFATSFYTTLRFPKLLLVYWLCMLNRMLLGFLIMIESFLRMFEKGDTFRLFVEQLYCFIAWLALAVSLFWICVCWDIRSSLNILRNRTIFKMVVVPYLKMPCRLSLFYNPLFRPKIGPQLTCLKEENSYNQSSRKVSLY